MTTLSGRIRLTRRRALIGTIMVAVVVVNVLLVMTARLLVRPTRLWEAIALFGQPTALYNCYQDNVSNGSALRMYFGDHLKITVRPVKVLDQQGNYGDLTPFSIITDIDRSVDRLHRSMSQMEWGLLPWHGFGTYPLAECL